jgi:hypothetical protein
LNVCKPLAGARDTQPESFQQPSLSPPPPVYGVVLTKISLDTTVGTAIRSAGAEPPGALGGEGRAEKKPLLLCKLRTAWLAPVRRVSG